MGRRQVLAGARPRVTPNRWSPAKPIRRCRISAFCFFPPITAGTSLTHDPALREVLIEAGRTLAQRFQEKGQYLRSFVGHNSLFIDIMMNVGIIFYAAARDRRPAAAGHRPAPLPHHPARAGARRRLHRARRYFRYRYGGVSAPDHAPGLSRRFLLVARTGLGSVRFHHRVRI